jgi:hypothetical protein
VVIKKGLMVIGLVALVATIYAATGSALEKRMDQKLTDIQAQLDRLEKGIKRVGSNVELLIKINEPAR